MLLDEGGFLHGEGWELQLFYLFSLFFPSSIHFYHHYHGCAYHTLPELIASTRFYKVRRFRQWLIISYLTPTKAPLTPLRDNNHHLHRSQRWRDKRNRSLVLFWYYPLAPFFFFLHAL